MAWFSRRNLLGDGRPGTQALLLPPVECAKGCQVGLFLGVWGTLRVLVTGTDVVGDGSTGQALPSQ